MITLFQLSQIVPATRVVIETFYPHIVPAMEKYEINTPLRIASFLAHAAGKSSHFMQVKEAWGPTEKQLGYEMDTSIGNINKGDGERFRGRGIFQIPGRDFYQKVAAGLGIDCVNLPEILEQPKFACLAAAWLWNQKKINELADKEDFEAITKAINDVSSGLISDRHSIYNKALTVLK